MKRFLLATALSLGLLAPAFGQVNAVPQVGFGLGYLPKTTYSSSFFGLVPVVTIGTDEVCISGSASKIVRVQRIQIWGTTATAPQTVSLSLVRRTSLDTGGTPAGTTANPGTATQIASRDTGQASNTSSSAVLVSYTAAPTIVDTAPVYIEAQLLGMPIVTSVMAPTAADFNFEAWTSDNIGIVTLRGTTQQVCVNNNAALTNASSWSGTITWTEE